MKCRVKPDELTAWLMGELTPARSRKIAFHVDRCAACRREVEELSATCILLFETLDAGSEPAQYLGEPRREQIRHAAVLPAASKPHPVWSRVAALLILLPVLAILYSMTLPALSRSRGASEAVKAASDAKMRELEESLAKDEAYPAMVEYARAAEADGMAAGGVWMAGGLAADDDHNGSSAGFGVGAASMTAIPQSAPAPVLPAEAGERRMGEPVPDSGHISVRRSSTANAPLPSAPVAVREAAEQPSSELRRQSGRGREGEFALLENASGRPGARGELSAKKPTGAAAVVSGLYDGESEPAPFAALEYHDADERMKTKSDAGGTVGPGMMAAVGAERLAVSTEWTDESELLAMAPRPEPPPLPPPPEPEPAGLPLESAAREPFSTFGVDTDNASYVYTRQLLRQGLRPEPGQVRVEEFVNHFDYRYGAPSGDAVFAWNVEAAPNPFRRGNVSLRVGLQARRLSGGGGDAPNICVIIDGSGSMAIGDRWTPAVQSVELLRQQLAEGRQFMVMYGGEQMLPYWPEDKTGPAGAMRLLTVLQQAEAYTVGQMSSGGQPTQVLFITDGEYAIAEEEFQVMTALCRSMRAHRVIFNVVAFGEGPANRQLEKLAEEGGGVMVFVDSPEEVERVFVEQFDARFRPVADDVKIQIEFNPLVVKRYRRIGYDERAMAAEDFRNDAVRSSAVGSGQAVTALYELQLDQRARPESLAATMRVRYREPGGIGFAEEEYYFRAGDIVPDFSEASTACRQAVLTAELAEYLKYPDVPGIAQPAGILAVMPAGADPEVIEMANRLK